MSDSEFGVKCAKHGQYFCLPCLHEHTRAEESGVFSAAFKDMKAERDQLKEQLGKAAEDYGDRLRVEHERIERLEEEISRLRKYNAHMDGTCKESTDQAASMREQRDQLKATQDKGGCSLAGPGRGDCEHFVGLPGLVEEVNHDGPPTEDIYGKPNGWCWFCWQAEQLSRAETESRQLKAERDALAEACRAMQEWILRQTMTSGSEDGCLRLAHAALAQVKSKEPEKVYPQYKKCVCNSKKPHFCPPCMGDAGFYACDVPEEPSNADQ